MGALTSNRKRGDEFSSLNHQSPYQNSPNFHISKKPRFSSMHQSPNKPVLSSNNTVSRISRYPEAKPPLCRELHAPCRIQKFGFSSRSSQDSRPRASGYSEKEEFGNGMGNFFSHNYDKAKRSAFDVLRYFKKGKEVIDVDNEPEKEVVSDDSSIKEVEVIEDGREGPTVVSVRLQKFDEKMVEERNLQPSTSSVVTDINDGNLRVDAAGKMFDSLSLNHKVVDISSVEAYRKLLEDAEKRTPKLKALDFEISFNEKRWALLRELRPVKKPVEKPAEEVPREPFVPLTEEEEAEVEHAFSATWRKVLVTHENSNIDITGEKLQCLRPGEWLNDEVINLYLELLKERETSDPQKFLRCHFFNTFFYKKLVSGGNGYNYKAVRRWTSERKLGYHLIECDKIFVPIHKEIHWCLAVINKKDQKFQYLDSLKGRDVRVLNALTRYFVEEVKDKSGKDIDITSWEQEFVEDLPEQRNGFDCGMFMLKYIDFYSRGVGLCFNQDHMPYFRLRTAKEILRLKAN